MCFSSMHMMWRIQIKANYFYCEKLQVGLILNIQRFLNGFNLKIPYARKRWQQKKNFHIEDTSIGPNRTQLSGPRFMHPWITGLGNEKFLKFSNFTLIYRTYALKNSWFQTFPILWMLSSFFWVNPDDLNFMCRRFGTLCLCEVHTTYEDGTYSVFRNVGT